MPHRQSVSPIKRPEDAPIVELADLEADWGTLNEIARPRSMLFEVRDN